MIEYILITTIILLTGSIWGWALPSITIVQIVVSVLYFLKKKSIHKMNIQKRNLLIMSALLVVYVFNMIVIARLNIFNMGYFLILVQIICLFLIAESINKENFIMKFINIIFVMSFMSLLFWALARKGIMIAPMIVEPGNGNIYRMNLFYIYRSYSSFPSLNEFNARNFGVFWEGGVYQSFVNIALFWLIDLKKSIKYFRLKAIVFVLTIITTFSSVGYFILILNLMFFVIKYSRKFNFKKILMILVACILAVLILNSPAVVNKFSSESSSYISYQIRMNDNLSGIKVALYSPVWGLGYQSTKYFSELEKVGITANSSGILSTAQKFGIIFAVFLIIKQCKNFNLVLSNRNSKTLLISSTILILIFSSEPLTLYEFYLLWAFQFASRSKEKKCYPTIYSERVVS
jgi:hypothetical protein